MSNIHNRYLFRGKRVDNKEWAVGAFCPKDSCETSLLFPDKHAHSCIIPLSGKDEGYWQRVDPETVGQCSGLSASKSFRGEKPEDLLMFDGDLIYDSDLEFYGVVQFCEDTMAWMVCVPEAQTGDREWLEQFIDSKTGTASTTKIVGIIYDMPELPEGVEEETLDD